jgi:hypothetical protein
MPIYSCIAEKDYYEKSANLVSQLKELVNVFISAQKLNQQPKLSQKQFDNIHKSWNEFAESNNGQSQFNVQSAIEKAFSKKSSTDTKIELENIISKLNGDMTDRLRARTSISTASKSILLVL